jgi:hypothetical protein
MGHIGKIWTYGFIFIEKIDLMISFQPVIKCDDKFSMGKFISILSSIAKNL